MRPTALPICRRPGRMRLFSCAQWHPTPISHLLFIVLLLIAANAPAEPTYPDKPLRMLVGFPPGSQPDIVARLVGQKLAEALQKPVVVENIAGASGNIAADRLAKATPDGYTLGLLSQTHMVISPALYKLPYDPVKDFAPVSQLTISPNILVVHNMVPVNDVRGLVALGKAKPGALTFASAGNGTGTHIAAELFRSFTDIDIRHIPYKGVVAALPDLLGARVSMMFSPIPVVLPSVHQGKLRALAVTSLKRSSALPDLPTVAESGYPRFEATNWYGLLVPKGTPMSIVRKLDVETVNVLALPDLHTRLADLGMQVIGNSPGEFAAAIKSELPKWAKLIKDAGITAD